MLRKLIVVAIVANFLIIMGSVFTSIDWRTNGSAIADNTTAIYSVGANVPEFLEINALLMPLDANGDPDWNHTASSIDFGTLEPIYVNGSLSHLMGHDAYAAVMFPVTSGRRYQLVQSGTALEGGLSGNSTIPDGAYVMIPDYVAEDRIGNVTQGAFPTGATLHPPVSAVGVNHPIYTSNPAGTTKAIRAYLAIPSPDPDIRNYSRGSQGGQGQGSAQIYDGWQPVTTNQESGDYDGSVTFTLNLI